MEITYIREMEHNCMIVHPEGEAAEYALKMLEAQPLKTLVPFEARSINAERYLYYRIDAMQSLENRCLAKKMNMEELRTLFEALRGAERELREYLLGVDSLYLTPETVFLDRVSGAYRFVCMPFSHGGAGDLAGFTEALCALTDPADTAAAEAVYRLCECARSGDAGLRDLRIWPPEAYTPSHRQQEAYAPHGQAEPGPYRGGEGREAVYAGIREAGVRPVRAEQLEEGVWYDTAPAVRRTDTEEAEAPVKRKPLSMRLLAFLFAVILLADIYIRKEYILTPAGNILSLAVIGIGIAGLCGSLLCARRARKGDGEEAPDDGNGYGADAPDRVQAGLWDDLYERDEEAAEEAPGAEAYAPVFETAYGRQAYEPVCDAACDAGTVFLAPKKHTRTAKLYGRDNVHNCHVPLEKLPLTLGKLAGHVDFLLRDESVSRIHAHISKDDSGRICVRDLNSTNGTFLNGIRLVPNETVSIREGDEVCFGDMVFEYL